MKSSSDFLQLFKFLVLRKTPRNSWDYAVKWEDRARRDWEHATSIQWDYGGIGAVEKKAFQDCKKVILETPLKVR